MFTSKVAVFIQFQLVIIVSAPSLRNRSKGRMLIKKASFTAVFTWVRAQPSCFGWGVKVVRMG